MEEKKPKRFIVDEDLLSEMLNFIFALNLDARLSPKRDAILKAFNDVHEVKTDEKTTD